MNSNIGGSSSNLPPPTAIPTPQSSPVGRDESAGAIPPPGIIPETSETHAKEVFANIDTMSENIMVQGFPTTQQWSPQIVYNTPMQSPSLPPPLTDPESQPFEPDWQLATKKLFEKKIREGVVKKKKEGSQELSHSEIEKQVSQILQTLHSKGGRASLSREDQKIVDIATKETQEAVGLPGTWSINSSSKADWTPVKINPPVPPNMEIVRKELLCINCEELLGAIDRVGKKVENSLPPDSKQKDAVTDLIRAIAHAIRDLKAVLVDLQMKDALWAEKTSGAKYKSIDERQSILEKTIEKNREAERTREKRALIFKIVKIFGPIVSGLIVIIGIFSIPFTGGASTALIVAGVAISSLMLAYSVADSAFDVTNKIVSACGQALEKMFPGEENAWKRKLVKAVFLAVFVVILVAGIVFSGGSAAASAASTMAAAITKEVVKAAVKLALAQLAIQVSIIAIMSSNILPELFSDLLIKCGVLDSKDSKGKMIAQFIITAVTMLTILAAVAFGRGAGAGQSIGKLIKTGLDETCKSISNAFKNALDMASKLLKSIKEGGQAAIKQIQEMIKQLKTMLTQLMTAIKSINIKEIIVGFPEKIKNAFLTNYHKALDALGRLKDYISSGALKEAIKSSASQAVADLTRLLAKAKDAIGELLNDLAEISKKMAQAGLDKIKKAANDLLDYFKTLPKDIVDSFKSFRDEAWFRKIQDAARAVNLSVEVGTGIYVGVLGVYLGKLTEEIGDLEKSQEISLMLMKLFDELLASFQGDVKMRSEWLTNLQNALNSVYSAATQSVQRAGQSAI